MMARRDLMLAALLLLMFVQALDGQLQQQSTSTANGGEDESWWWRTTPFASLPGMTSKQVLRSILPPDVIPYTPVTGPEGSAGYVRDYVSVFKVQSRGMEHLHTYVNMFLSFITPRHLVPPGIQLSTDPEMMLEQGKTKWQVILTHYAGILAVAVVGLIIAIAVPVTGFFICCCRCAGNCGGKEEPFEKRADKCQRVMLGLLLGVLLLLVVFGIICAFVSNANAEEGIEALPTALRHTAEDTTTYFNQTRKEYATLLTTNYRELETAIAKALDDSGRLVTDELKYVSRAVAMDNLTAIVSNLAEIRQNLASIEQDTGILQDNARELQNGLLEVKRQLKLLLDRCASLPVCVRFRQQYNLDALSVDLQFQEFMDNYILKLPDVQRMARNISRVIETGVESEVKRGRAALERVSNDVQRAVGSTLPTLKQHLRSAGQSLERNAEDISILMGRGMEMSRSESVQDSINTMQSYIDQYGQYRFYVDIGIAGLVLLITLCFAFGLLCGCCGKRPADRYDDDFGTRATGASCLMAGVGLVFMTSFVLLVLTCAHFLVGVFGQNLSCEVLTHLGTGEEAQQRELYDFIDRNLPLTALNPHGVVKDDLVTVSNIVKECHQNRTLYQMLKLERVLDVSTMADQARRLNIEAEVRRLTSNIRFDRQMTLLTPEAKQQLRDFSNSDLLRVNFTAYSILLEQNITSVNLLEMAAILNNTAIQVQLFDPSSANTLWDNSIFLTALQSSRLLPMKAAAQRLRKAAANLEERIRFNQSSLPEAIEMLIGQAESAQTFLQNKGPEQLTKLAVAFGKECERLIDQYIQRVADHVQNKVGKCWPLSQAYNTTTTVICQQIFWPFNGFWASVGWCCLLFLPCIIVAMFLATLYRKTDPYPGSIVEREYLYDAYADRDNIPLALNNRDRRGLAPPSGIRSGHSYGHVYGGAYEDDYSISQHQARTTTAAAAAANGRPATATMSSTTSSAVVAPAERNGKTSAGRYQDPAPRAWGDGGPRYVASPTHSTTATSPSVSASTSAAAAAAAGSPSAPLPADYERPPPYYYPGPADK